MDIATYTQRNSFCTCWLQKCNATCAQSLFLINSEIFGDCFRLWNEAKLRSTEILILALLSATLKIDVSTQVPLQPSHQTLTYESHFFSFFIAAKVFYDVYNSCLKFVHSKHTEAGTWICELIHLFRVGIQRYKNWWNEWMNESCYFKL